MEFTVSFGEGRVSDIWVNVYPMCISSTSNPQLTARDLESMLGLKRAFRDFLRVSIDLITIK